jgi:hypothetical protein
MQKKVQTSVLRDTKIRPDNKDLKESQDSIKFDFDLHSRASALLGFEAPLAVEFITSSQMDSGSDVSVRSFEIAKAVVEDWAADSEDSHAQRAAKYKVVQLMATK